MNNSVWNSKFKLFQIFYYFYQKVWLIAIESLYTTYNLELFDLMQKENHYKTIFISDLHLWNPKNLSHKALEFLQSISMENLIICWDFIDFRQLDIFNKRKDKEAELLEYINHLSRNGTKVIYIQWNHDHKIKDKPFIHFDKRIEISKELYYTTQNGKTYYITHWDNSDLIVWKLPLIWRLWNLIYSSLFYIENLRNKRTFNEWYISLGEKIEIIYRKLRFSPKKILKQGKKLSKNLTCNWIIFWHYHTPIYANQNWFDYYNTWDWVNYQSAVIENKEWELKLIFFEKSKQK